MSLWVSGVTSCALVPLGTARRFKGGEVLSSMSPELKGTVIKPIAEGVGVIGGTGFAAFFLFGVDGATSGISAFGGFFLFLLIFATFGGGISFAGLEACLRLGDASLNRADLRDVMMYVLKLNCGFGTLITVFCLTGKDRCSLKEELRRAAVVWRFWCQ